MKKDSIIAIIPAGGIGKRMNSQKPKQFLTLYDKPILVHTIRTLALTKLIDKFIIPTVDMVYTKKIIKSYLEDIDVTICKGGKTRQESIFNGLKEMKKLEYKHKFVLIHDAVRALVKKETIEAVINKAQESGAAIAAQMVTDTLKLSYSNKENVLIKKNVPRDNMWQAQTPQVFETKILLESYQQAKKDHYIGTDSASLVERIGIEVYLVESPSSNIKITTPDDLELAKIYLEHVHNYRLITP